MLPPRGKHQTVATSVATAGLDAALGILHTDQPYRDSLALDVMEAARPVVDQYVKELLAGHHFEKRDFHETERGSCRINRRLTHALAETTHTWHQAVAPTIENVAKTLAGKRPKWQRPAPTRLTQANRSAGRAAQRKGPTTPKRQSTSQPAGRCAECGTEIKPRKRRCPPCNTEFQTARIDETRIQQWEQRRQTSRDPSHGGDAAARRGATNRGHQNAIAAWQPGNRPTDPDYYRKEVLPGLTTVTTRTISKSLGVSDPYARQIRNGNKTPHPRHWAKLRRLGADRTDS